MAATVDHPAFPQPPDFSAKIWRYIDFTKFVSFSDGSKLYLARLDQMPDPFEGSLSRAEFDQWKEVAEQGERTGAIPDDWKGRYLDILLASVRSYGALSVRSLALTNVRLQLNLGVRRHAP
jgi:hypothetical protein